MIFSIFRRKVIPHITDSFEMMSPGIGLPFLEDTEGGGEISENF
jgi:hypothetical protein